MTADHGRPGLGPQLALPCLLCFVLFFVGLGDRPLWDIDEGMHAATAKDMIQTGDWITPMMNGEPFFDKPALFNWCVAASFSLFGFTELAARLPAALLGTACVLVTFWLGAALFNRRTGLLGGVVLVTSLMVVIMSRVVVHDILLTACIAAALACWWRAYRTEGSRRLPLLGFYVAAGLAVLAKGPLGLVLLGIVIVPFLLWERRTGFLLEMGVPWGMLVFLLVAGPWYAAMMWRHPDYAEYFFITQNFGNFASARPRHPAPASIYLVSILGGLFPWSALLPAALREAVRRGQDPGARSAFRFLLVWSVSILAFFALASSRVYSYVLPLFPAAALLIGVAWDRLIADPRHDLRRWFLALLPVPLALVAMAFAWTWTVRLAELKLRYDVEPVQAVVPLSLVVAGLLAALVLFALRRYRSSFASLAGTTVALILALTFLVLPAVSPHRTTRELGRRLDAILPEGDPIVCYWNLFDSALFYTPRRLMVIKDPGALMAGLGVDQPAYCIIDRRDLATLDELRAATEVIAREGRKMILWNRIPPPPPAPGTGDREPGTVPPEPASPQPLSR